MARLIDTSVVIDVERRRQSPDVLTDAVLGAPVVMAAITASELLGGVHRAPVSDRRREREVFVEAVLARIPVVPFDLPAARIHARIWAELEAAGQRIDANDLLIAATALAHGHTVITHNLRDFARVPGLDVRQPPW